MTAAADGREGGEGDARLAPFRSQRGWQFGLLGMLLVTLVAGGILAIMLIETWRGERIAAPVDFRVFWSAGRLAAGGEPLAALDIDRLAAVHQTATDMWMPFLYPPGFLVLITPLGMLSFTAAMLCWTIASLVLVALAYRPFVAGVTPLWLGMVFAPAYLPVLVIGQTSLLWLAGLLAALAALRAERWLLAGFIFGCLTLKPQLGLLIPVALVAIGAWRTILAAAVTTILVAALPTLVVGVEYWEGLRDNIAGLRDAVLQDVHREGLMVGPLSLLAALGVPSDRALAVQWLATAAAAVAVFVTWRSRGASFDLKAAVLLLAMPVSSPYLWYYEMTLLAAAALFVVRAGVVGLQPPGVLLFLGLWMATGPLIVARFLDIPGDAFLGASLITTLIFIGLVLCLRRLRGGDARAATPSAP